MRFIYTGELELPLNLIEPIMSLSQELQVHRAAALCQNILSKMSEITYITSKNTSNVTTNVIPAKKNASNLLQSGSSLLKSSVLKQCGEEIKHKTCIQQKKDEILEVKEEANESIDGDTASCIENTERVRDEQVIHEAESIEKVNESNTELMKVNESKEKPSEDARKKDYFDLNEKGNAVRNELLSNELNKNKQVVDEELEMVNENIHGKPQVKVIENRMNRTPEDHCDQDLPGAEVDQKDVKVETREVPSVTDERSDQKIKLEIDKADVEEVPVKKIKTEDSFTTVMKPRESQRLAKKKKGKLTTQKTVKTGNFNSDAKAIAEEGSGQLEKYEDKIETDATEDCSMEDPENVEEKLTEDEKTVKGRQKKPKCTICDKVKLEIMENYTTYHVYFINNVKAVLLHTSAYK